ncbi:MAG: hypothetical protein N4A74_19385, partial [Carboxylicivirga sp.]|nr:hypothetical protein [Carboxylicivirga sp.]
MKRIGKITLMLVLCVSCLVACSDSDVITDKDIVSEALTKGSWQVSLQHALTQIDLDQSQVALTLSPTGDVNAQRLESSSGQLTRYDGAYALFYDHD